MARIPVITGSLSTRLVILVGLPALLILGAALTWLGVRDFRSAEDRTKEAAQDLARIEAFRLDRALAEAARIPDMHARILESGALRDEATLKIYLTNVVAKNRDLIYGSCMGFEANSFYPEKVNFCPYAYWDKDVPVYTQIVPPDYNHFEWDWYQKPKKLGHAIWTEPYFDEGGGNVLMTTRSVPFMRPANMPDAGKFWGVATIDISLHRLVADLAMIKVAETGYAFLISPEGRYLSHPKADKVMKGTLQQDNVELAKVLMGNTEGFVMATEPVMNRQAWVAFASVPNGDFTLALVYPAEEVMRPAYRSLLKVIGVGLLGIVLLVGVLYFIAHSVTKPITRLAGVARKISEGDLDMRLSEDVNIQEVRELASAFHKMTRDLKMRMEELKYTTTLKERMAGELNAARRIQMSMLPKEWAAHSHFHKGADVSLHAIIQPAREVGGDFYDYRFLDENRLSLLIGDVSGKGVPAALFMAMTQTLFKGYAAPERSAAEMMARVNQALCGETHTGMFVTLFHAVMDVRTGELELCNAGHLPPLLLTQDGKCEALKTARNPALGIVPNMVFASEKFVLKPEDKLVCYTDGVTEAFNSDHQIYTLEKFEALLVENYQMSVEQLTQLVTEDVRAHSGNMEPSDDLTVLIVKRSGAPQEA